MPVLFKATQNTVKSADGTKKWRPALVKWRKVITTQQISEKIAEKSSLTPGDVHNVIRNMSAVMKDYLMNSFTVNLEGLGTFTLSANVRGNSVDDPDDVNYRQINNLRIRFTPSGNRDQGQGTTRSMYTGISYERWYGNVDANGKAIEDNGSGSGSGNPDDEFIDPTA